MDAQGPENLLRRKLEKILSEKDKLPQRVSPGDKESLIQELMVQQVELEMQNDELRKAQQKIEESRSRYVDLYDFAPVGYFTLNKKGGITGANLAGASLLRIERGLLFQFPFFQFIMPEDQDRFRECQRKVSQTLGRQSCELRLKRKENDPLWVRLESVAVEDPDGKLTGTRLAVMDISDRKRAEKEVLRLNVELEAKVTERTVQLETANKTLRGEIAGRERAEQEIRQSEKEFRGIFESSSVGMIERDASTGQRLHVNPRLCEMTGYSAKELLNEKDLILTHPDDRERDQIVKAGVLMGKFTNWASEKRYVRKDGEVIWVHVNGRLIRDSSDQPYRTVAVIQDITERKRAEEELRKAKDELELRVQERTEELTRSNQELREEMDRREKAEEGLRQAQKMEAIGTLAGGIAHDFNNMLMAIILYSELVLKEVPEDGKAKIFLEDVLRAADRGRALVRQILTFSRKSEKQKVMLSVIPLIKETFKFLRSSLPSTIEMNLRLETEADGIIADPAQIQQVIMNLANNAAYAMRGKAGKIEISLKDITFHPEDTLPEPGMSSGDYLVLSVSDTGCGMSEEVRKRVFEPFFTTKPTGEGTGLGLSVVHGIVKAQRGGITVYSEPWKCSVFHIYLPKAELTLEKERSRVEPIPRGSERILFVDDEEIIVNAVPNVLGGLGYHVTALTDSGEALKLFAKDPQGFDLVITDQTMPVMTGENLAQEMLCIRADIPVILCTGYSELISPEKAMEIGIRGFIMKPFTLREGASLVRQMLDQRRSQ